MRETYLRFMTVVLGTLIGSAGILGEIWLLWRMLSELFGPVPDIAEVLLYLVMVLVGWPAVMAVGSFLLIIMVAVIGAFLPERAEK